MNLLYYFITSLVFTGIIYIIHSRDKNNWLKALIITVSFVVAGLLVSKFGILMYLITLPALLFVIMKVMQYELSSALLFLLGTGIIFQVIDFVAGKYFY